MPSSEFSQIWPWRRQWERMSDVKAALELFQRTRFIVQLSPRQDLWSLTLSKGKKRGGMFWDQRDFRCLQVWEESHESQNQDPANPPGGFCESVSNISEVAPVSLLYSTILPSRMDFSLWKERQMYWLSLWQELHLNTHVAAGEKHTFHVPEALMVTP